MQGSLSTGSGRPPGTSKRDWPLVVHCMLVLANWHEDENEDENDDDDDEMFDWRSTFSKLLKQHPLNQRW